MTIQIVKTDATTFIEWSNMSRAPGRVVIAADSPVVEGEVRLAGAITTYGITIMVEPEQSQSRS